MAEKAMRGSAFHHTVFGHTQTSVQQKAALKLSFCGECEEIELQTSREMLRNHKAASQALILYFVMKFQNV